MRTQVTTKGTKRTKESQRIPVLRLHTFRVIRPFRGQSGAAVKCQIPASAVVHADETSWSLNSVWAFLSEKARVLVFGCRKDGETLAQLLPKDSFSLIAQPSDFIHALAPHSRS